MFKLKPTSTFTRKVTVIYPGERKQVQGSFNVTFNLLPTDERQRIFEDEGIESLIDAIVESVDGVEVPDGYDAREVVLNNQPCRGAILAKYNSEVDGIERKNLKI